MATVPIARQSVRGEIAAFSGHPTFSFGGQMLRVETSDASVAHLLREAYAPMARDPQPARFHAVLRRLSDGRLYARFGRQAVALTHSADALMLRAAHHAAREIFARFAASIEGSVALYGALCAIDGKGVLLLGPTAIGKTLLALHLAEQGARLLGDDTLLLLPITGEACAMPRRPTLRDTALPLLPSPEMRDRVRASSAFFDTDRGRFWYSLDGDVLGGLEPSDRVYPVRAVCVLRHRGEEPALMPMEAADAVPLLAQRAYARPASLAQLSLIRRAIRRASCFDLVLGDPAASAALLAREVRACG